MGSGTLGSSDKEGGIALEAKFVAGKEREVR